MPDGPVGTRHDQRLRVGCSSQSFFWAVSSKFKFIQFLTLHDIPIHSTFPLSFSLRRSLQRKPLTNSVNKYVVGSRRDHLQR